jgi:hypothetical protein
MARPPDSETRGSAQVTISGISARTLPGDRTKELTEQIAAGVTKTVLAPNVSRASRLQARLPMTASRYIYGRRFHRRFSFGAFARG